MSEVLQQFFKQVGRRDLLTREEEIELSQRIEKGDRRARDKMIQANLRLAISIAKKYQDKGCDLSDLIQESSVGLMKAVDRFDWRRGFKFSTYACWWIKQSVRRHIADQAGMIKLPSHTKNMMWKIKQTSAEYEEEFGQQPTTEELAALLGVSEDTIENAITCSIGTVASLDSAVHSNNDESSRQLGETIVDTNAEDPAEAIDRQKTLLIIRSALNSLSPREEKIMRLRFGISEFENDHINFPITRSQVESLNSKENSLA
jgi:RNA polymerase primary sigma factor